MSNDMHTSDGVRELIEEIRRGAGEAFEQLLGMYEPMISAAVHRYLPEGADPDDARQEALAGFFRATLTYDPDQSAVAFGLYAKVCVSNALISHTREIARRARRTASNIEYDDYVRYCADAAADPSERVVERESVDNLRRIIKENLSPYENRVWDMYVKGMSSRDIAEVLDRSARSIDNALYRIRKKLRALLESGEHQ